MRDRASEWQAWASAGATLWLDGLFLEDALTPPGGQSTIDRWHGLPWWMLLFLGVLLAHAFLANALWTAVFDRLRVRATRWALMAALLGAVIGFHGLFWDSGTRALRLFGLESRAEKVSKLRGARG